MKIICVGKNYKTSEEGIQSKNPIVFLKPDTSILPNHRDFYIPEFSQNIHYEIELVIKICKVGKYISEEFAGNYFNEVALGLDFTAKDLQKECSESGNPWEISKAFDHSTVLGKFLPKNSFDWKNSTFKLIKNGETVQQTKPSEMIFSIEKIIAYVSKFFTLKIGDVIFTGTPSGANSILSNDILEGYFEDSINFSVKIK
jgi:2-keto-4-pentenoate hydratase/2-oxohepta-3-ene-1,7-dioic acid hydratase in catechol pathway